MERGLVRARGMGEAGELADELGRRGAHFLVGRRRLEVEQGLDVAAHGISPGLAELDFTTGQLFGHPALCEASQ